MAAAAVALWIADFEAKVWHDFDRGRDAILRDVQSLSLSPKQFEDTRVAQSMGYRDRVDVDAVENEKSGRSRWRH